MFSLSLIEPKSFSAYLVVERRTLFAKTEKWKILQRNVSINIFPKLFEYILFFFENEYSMKSFILFYFYFYFKTFYKERKYIKKTTRENGAQPKYTRSTKREVVGDK